MIQLTTQITQVVISQDGVAQQSIVTDTLFIQEARFDLLTGAVYATVMRGTLEDIQPVKPKPPGGGPQGFVQNYPTFHATINPDGSFVTDSTFSGDVGAIPIADLVVHVVGQLDQLVAACVGGTVIPNVPVLPSQQPVLI